MPKKRESSSRTDPFGHIAFSKDGRVRKHVEQLSSYQSEREPDVANRFAEGLSKVSGATYVAKPCEQNDHDFWLSGQGQTILVQATSIMARDYLRPISKDDYQKVDT